MQTHTRTLRKAALLEAAGTPKPRRPKKVRALEALIPYAGPARKGRGGAGLRGGPIAGRVPVLLGHIDPDEPNAVALDGRRQAVVHPAGEVLARGVDAGQRRVVVGAEVPAELSERKRELIIDCGPTTTSDDDLTVIGVLDLSGSVKQFAQLPPVPDLGRPSTVEYLRRWFRQATQTRAADDRFGLIVFDGEATATP